MGYILAFFLGAAFGVFSMCILIVGGRTDDQEERRNDRNNRT